MLTAIDLAGSKEEIDAIFALATAHAKVEEVSEPTSLDASRALNVGLPHIDPTLALNFVTLVFSTGTAALAFFKELRGILKDQDSGIAVSETTSGKSLGQIKPATSDEELEKMVSP